MFAYLSGGRGRPSFWPGRPQAAIAAALALTAVLPASVAWAAARWQAPGGCGGHWHAG